MSTYVEPASETRECKHCKGEGGWYSFSVVEPKWVRCVQCYGFGVKSAAADLWARGITLETVR